MKTSQKRFETIIYGSTYGDDGRLGNDFDRISEARKYAKSALNDGQKMRIYSKNGRLIALYSCECGKINEVVI